MFYFLEIKRHVIVWELDNYCTIYKTNEQNSNCQTTKRVSKPKLLLFKLIFMTSTLTVITLHIKHNSVSNFAV